MGGVDKNRILAELEAATLAELLDSLAAAPSRPKSRVGQWLASAGIIPGMTRVLASTLYEEYKAWEMQQGADPREILTILMWGKEMTRRIRRGRGRAGNIYYISRER